MYHLALELGGVNLAQDMIGGRGVIANIEGDFCAISTTSDLSRHSKSGFCSMDQRELIRNIQI